ncbi:hypothetical protein BGZ65_004150 [Modicella reniformis]|uniref:Uncharacterized protein n=1 Tax=Modicella reniformis TaxID=1440133 RepID=A0A9P6IKD1_9FUNG|nr:hypothetical protein BGZ65_004150 [Modicella reniformis]
MASFTFHHPANKIANVLVYLTLLSGNIYSTFGVDHGQESKYLSYITPAPWTFLIWTVIHFLLGGMIVYQFFNDKLYDAVSWHFVWISIINSIWLALWTSDHTIFALIAMFFVVGGVSNVYYGLKKTHAADTLCETLFLHLPFSLYHAWSFVLFLVNAFAVVSPVKENGPTTFQSVLAVLGLALIVGIVIGYIEYGKVGSLAMGWYLFGVFAKQQNPIIHWTSLGFGVFVVLYTLKPFIAKAIGRGQTGGESAPLLG